MLHQFKQESCLEEKKVTPSSPLSMLDPLRQERPLPMHEHRQLGQAMITLADDHFINGYQAGHLQYMLGYRTRLLSDEDIYHFLANNLLTPFHSNRWNAGYVMGWLITLYEKQMASPVSSQREAEQQEVLR